MKRTQWVIFIVYSGYKYRSVCDTNKNSVMTPKFENELGIR